MEKGTTFAIGKSGKVGFTLVEVLTVLVIISLMLGIGIPFFRGSSQRMRLKASLRNLVFLGERAKWLSVSEHAPTTLAFDQGCVQVKVLRGGSWEVVGDPYCFPPGVTVTPLGDVKFLPSGEAEESVCIRVENAINQVRFVCVSSLSGKFDVKARGK